MTPGYIVVVDWRDAITGSGEPNKRRPGIVVGSPDMFESNFPFDLVVPLTASSSLVVAGASVQIEPSSENRCTKTCYALAWNAQSVPHARMTETSSRIRADELHLIRTQIAACIGL